MKRLLFCLILFVCPGYAQNNVGLEEAALMKTCTKNNLPACESLGAYYIKKENWEKATIVGKALCENEIALGCTYAGVAMLALSNPYAAVVLAVMMLIASVIARLALRSSSAAVESIGGGVGLVVSTTFFSGWVK